ncbi:MAG: extracellular solute-binding protein [Candidatus Komeilibacteria bacterium]|nr:extracellular solute-binding protein [Candidatus Komeilibacteria bacterium]
MLKQNFKKISLLLLAVIFLTSGFSCKLIPTTPAPAGLIKTIQLSYWGVWDDPDYLSPLINDFQALHPNIKITYRKFRQAEYETKLLAGWATDEGPDLYSIPASWLKKYQNFITPQPAEVQLAFTETTSTLGKTETNTVVRSVPIFSPADIKNKFVDVVAEDVMMNNKIYGLPYSLDTLALFYNRALLDKAGVATPPADWDELTTAVKKISQVDAKNKIVQAGLALGTAGNVNHAVDILSLLMMQSGAQMMGQNGVAFANPLPGDEQYVPGLKALEFYTAFANPLNEVYSWNKDQPSSLDAFISGQAAMILGYAYDLPVIKSRSPKLDFGVTALPQVKNAATPINYTDYWVETVSHKAKNVAAAWGFLNFANSSAEITKYLTAAKKPAALRQLIAAQTADPVVGIFARQTLTAKRWYQGKDPLKMEEVMQDLITNFPLAPDPLKLLRNAAEKVNATL